MAVSGALLTVAATGLAGSVAAAAPLPASAHAVVPALERPAAVPAPAAAAAGGWTDVAPASAHRLRPAAPAARPAARSAAAPARQQRRPAHREQSRSIGRLSPLQRAVARIPGYARHRPARWVLSSRYGNYGVTDLLRTTVYISPRVPASRLDDVVRHEWGHILSVRAYGGSVPRTTAGLNRTFGGAGLTGAERAADCVATVLGASWRHYTSCSDRRWQASARSLLAGRRP